MSTGKRYDEEFKRTLVDLYRNGKTQASLIKEYLCNPVDVESLVCGIKALCSYDKVN